MIQMRNRLALLMAVTGAALVPAPASALMEAVPSETIDAKASCPDTPCLAVSRTIGYQAKVGDNRGLMKIPRNGRIVSWTIKLGNPGAKQIDFFNQKLGGESKASIAVLRFGRKLRARVVTIAPPVKLERYFGRTVEIPLEKTIEVKKGWVLGLSVPTWAPALAVNLPGTTSWRASRKKGACDDTQTQTAAPQNSVPQFYCLYRTARVTYSARIISTP
jgi:hypothetical protein